jgi:SAM-dependent methyltransferase
MKTRESGMPDAVQWNRFFEPEGVLDRLQLAPETGDVVEFGCGYGTFTIPAARRSKGTVYTFDIEPEMVAFTAGQAAAGRLNNVCAQLRDFVAEGTGLPDGQMAYAMLFNILHAEQPELLLREAWRVLRAGGLLGILHWNYDPATPRGLSLAIRPRPERCRDWAIAAGFQLQTPGIVPLPPYHYGLVLKKPALAGSSS